VAAGFFLACLDFGLVQDRRLFDAGGFLHHRGFGGRFRCRFGRRGRRFGADGRFDRSGFDDGFNLDRLAHGRFDGGLGRRCLGLVLDDWRSQFRGLRSGLGFCRGFCGRLGLGRECGGVTLDVGTRLAHFHLNGA
jgi:hypothetical protein